MRDPGPAPSPDPTDSNRSGDDHADLLERLQRSQRDLEEAQRIARVGSWTLDPATGTATWSTEMYDVLGLDPLGPPVDLADLPRIFTPESVELVGAAVEAAIATGRPWQLDLEAIRPDGEHAWVSSRGVVETGPGGDVVMIRGTMQDITERRRLGTQLQQAQRLEAIGQLAGGIAHDFNNLLTAIRGYAELVHEALAEGDERRQDVEQILRAADRATELTRQLLAFGRRQVLQPRPVDPADLVDGIRPMVGRLMGPHIRLEVRASARGRLASVDPGQLEQVIVNLAANARDAMPEGGTLTIETGLVELDADYVAEHPEVTPGPHIALVVSDTGTGMDAATRARIFEPFFTTKPHGRGTGMGLATVHGIVKQSGGSIWVYSEPGYGSSFKIYLPLTGDEPRPSEPVSTADPASTGSEVILLVEDEDPIRAFAARTLRGFGYEVLEAADGAAALDLAARRGDDIGLLLTDVIMPGLQGHQVASQLRATRPALPVLFLSGFADNPIIEPLISAGTAGFLAKPFTTEALAHAVRQILDGPATERAR